MDDLISRQAVLDIIDAELSGWLTDDERLRLEGVGMGIELLPSAPKKGKWKPFDLTWGRSVWACDACGETVDVPTLSGKPIFDYCPWCGARMERSEE